jgi:hypothetical protein
MMISAPRNRSGMSDQEALDFASNIQTFADEQQREDFVRWWTGVGVPPETRRPTKADKWEGFAPGRS